MPILSEKIIQFHLRMIFNHEHGNPLINGGTKMDIMVHLEPEVASFYTRLAAATGRAVNQVLSDALFLLAGELSLEALRDRNG